MNADLKRAFSHIKPVCDVLMVCPSPESITAFITRVSELKNEVVQDLQQYLLFPLITHIKSTETDKKLELQCKLVDGMRVVLEKVTVNSYEMCMKIETGLLHLIFDSTKPGMIADIPEELKHCAMRCLTVLMLNINTKFREKLLKTQVPLLAQVVFVSVHIAKLDRLRALRLAAISCVTAHTVTHAQLTSNYRITNTKLETLTVEMLSSILPGVLAALQDVATCTDNPGHAVVVAAVDAIHRILCVTMQDKYLSIVGDVTAEDFANMVKLKQCKDNTDVSSKDKNPKDVPKRSPEWYAMAGDKLTLITKSLISLRTHEHFKVRKELAVFCSRLLIECNRTMQPSIPIAMDVLLSLAMDEYPEVSQYSADSINTYFANAPYDTRNRTMDSLCDNLFATLTTLPRVLNNIDARRKLSALNLVHGYVCVLCDDSRPQRLTTALSAAANMQRLCAALLEGADHHTRLAPQHARGLSSLPPTNSPWSKLRHLDSEECERRLQEICRLLGSAECAELVLDRLLEMFHNQKNSEIAYIMNWMGSATNSSPSLVTRILNTYLEEDVWYLPLEVGNGEEPITSQETLDVTVYNPRAWIKDSVPDLYEGTTETRYTDISYQAPRVRPHRDPSCCVTLAEAQRNLVLSCLLTEGVGIMARRLTDDYQPYLLRTLCLILERIGSRHELLHLAGLKAINDIAIACGHYTVADLIKCNADYFTHQITVRLKKAWNCQSALQILSVVMEYSDTSVLDCLYGIVEDVLVQSCDKYYEKDLHAYLQVFLTFVDCIRKWFPLEDNLRATQTSKDIDILEETREYIKNQEESERLLNNSEFEKESGKSVEEMYREDLKRREGDELNYDDKITNEKLPLPQHIKVTITILKRCLNFVTSKQRDDAILALQVLNQGLPVLKRFEDELLPLVHLTWSPLVARFQASEPVILRRAFDLLVTLAALSKDFIRSRSVKEVMPHIYTYLHKSAKDSYLKDAGSAYRNSQAYNLQVTVLNALPTLAMDLGLEDEGLEETMTCVDAYLSNKQPKPLQASAVNFFKVILDYNYGTAWYHLRKLCNNEAVLQPPTLKYMKLEPVVGTPFQPMNKDYEQNIKLIFDQMGS